MPIIHEYGQNGGDIGRLRTSMNPGQEGANARVGLQTAGHALQNTGDTIEHVYQQRDTASLQTQTAEARAKLTTRLQQAVESGDILKEDFDSQFQDELAAETARMQDSMTTALGRQAASVHGAQLSASFTQHMIERKALAAGEQAKRDYTRSLNIDANTLYTDPSQFASALQSREMALDATDGPYARLGKKEREALRDDTRQTMAVSAISGLMERNPTEAHRQILANEWDQFITPAQKIQLAKMSEAKMKDAEGRANLAAYKQLDDLAQNGMLAWDKVMASYDQGTLKTRAEAMGLWHKNQERVKEIERERQLQAGIVTGDRPALDAAGFSPKQQEVGFGVWSGKLMMEAQTPEQRAEAVNSIVLQGRKLDLISPHLQSTLNTASPVRPEQFVSAAAWYNDLNALDPAYTARHVSQEQAAYFHVYNAAVQGGQSPQQALETVRQAGDREKRQKFLKDLPASTMRDLETKIGPSLGDRILPWRDAITNAPWAANQIAEMAKMRMAFGDAPLDEAVKWATNQFTARHVAVGGRWLPMQGTAHPDTAKALTTYLNKAPAALEATGMPKDEIDPNGYDLRVDSQTRLDNSYQLYAKSTGLPVPGRRVSAQQAIRALEQVKEEEAKAQIPEMARKMKEERDAQARIKAMEIEGTQRQLRGGKP